MKVCDSLNSSITKEAREAGSSVKTLLEEPCSPIPVKKGRVIFCVFVMFVEGRKLKLE